MAFQSRSMAGAAPWTRIATPRRCGCCATIRASPAPSSDAGSRAGQGMSRGRRLLPGAISLRSAAPGSQAGMR